MGRTSIPPRGSDRKRIPIEDERMSIGVAGRHRQCATRTPEDGILMQICSRTCRSLTSQDRQTIGKTSLRFLSATHTL